MTRETKIGLLVGLGFIIVFAVLLSHTGPVPPAGDGQPWQLARGEGGPAPGTLMNGTVGEAPVVTVARSAPVPDEPVVVDAVTPAERIAEVVSLPRPRGVEPRRVDGPDVPAVALEAGLAPEEVATMIEIPRGEAHRADRLIDPEPGRRPGVPSSSSPEAGGSAGLASAGPSGGLSAAEHLVKKGETLGAIVEGHYGTSRGGILDLVVKANRDVLKSKDHVVAGQKLTMPALPPELFEAVSGQRTPASAARPQSPPARAPETPPRVARAGTGREVTPVGTGTGASERGEGGAATRRAPPAVVARKPAAARDLPEKPVAVVSGGGEQLPKAAREDSASSSEAGISGRGAVTEYEIRPGDTFSSIARRVLGSERRWREIAEMNTHVDPTRLKAGDRIRLPERKPQEAGPPAKRT